MKEVEKVELSPNLKYGMSLQFVDGLEKSGKNDVWEKLRLKDVIVDGNGQPWAEDRAQHREKDLRKIQVIDKREEVFQEEEYSTHYVKNDDRSRYIN